MPSCSPSPQEELDAHWTERVKSQTSMARMPSRMFAARPKDTLPLHTAGSQTFDLTGRTGSLMYMAPEVFHEQPYNEKVRMALHRGFLIDMATDSTALSWWECGIQRQLPVLPAQCITCLWCV